MLVRDVLSELAPLLLDLSRLKKPSEGICAVVDESAASCRSEDVNGVGDDSDDDDSSKGDGARKALRVGPE